VKPSESKFVDGIIAKEPGKLDGIHLSSEDCTRWENMVNRMGMHAVAKKMVRTKGWRAYAQRYSFDHAQTWDDMQGSDTEFRTLADTGPDIEELADIRMKRDKLVDSLSAKQKAIWDLYEQGKNPAEIKDILGYNTTEAIRWQKHKIKQKWIMVRDE